jgi:hypothetical protein
VRHQILREYLFYLSPAVLIPGCLYLSGDNITAVSLFKIGLLFPLLMLAMKGLAVFFPAENARERSLGRVAEYAILQGLVFAAFMVLFGGFMQPDLQSTLPSALRPFAVAALVMSPLNFFMAIQAQKKLRATEP